MNKANKGVNFMDKLLVGSDTVKTTDKLSIIENFNHPKGGFDVAKLECCTYL